MTYTESLKRWNICQCFINNLVLQAFNRPFLTSFIPTAPGPLLYSIDSSCSYQKLSRHQTSFKGHFVILNFWGQFLSYIYQQSKTCLVGLNGKGNGSPLQYSCLENPMDWGAWWAAVHSVSQSRTRLRRLSMHACIGEGNGNPLQYACLENSRDGGAWWAAVHGVARSWTRLKQLSSSSSSGSQRITSIKGFSQDLIHSS